MIQTRQLFGANSLGMDTVDFNDSPTCCKTCWILLQGCQAICKGKSGAFFRVVDACERLKLLCKLHSTLREKLSLEPSRTDAFITKLRWKRTLRSADRTLTHRQSHQQALQALGRQFFLLQLRQLGRGAGTLSSPRACGQPSVPEACSEVCSAARRESAEGACMHARRSAQSLELSKLMSG